MKNFKFFPIFFALVIMATLLGAPTAFALDDPQISARSAVLLDLSTGHVLFSKNENEKLYPASLTKIMTVLLAVEAIDSGKVSADDYVTASANITYDLVEEGSTANIEPGEALTLKDLLYCAMLPSANEACNIIAEYIGGSIPNFIVMMNRKAEELGCTGTNFTNTHGLPNDAHYTTASDLAKISLAATDYGLFMEISNTPYIEIPGTNLKPVPRILKNTNALLGDNDYYQGYTYEYARGIKTGHTSSAGYCLVSTAINGDYSLMAIVMGSTASQRENGTLQVGSFDDTIALYEWTFANWSYKEVLRSSKTIAEIPIEMGSDAESVSVRPAQAIFALLPNDVDMSIFEESILIYSERDGTKLKAPITAGEVLGEITIKRGSEVIGSSNLVAATSIDLSKIYYIRSEIMNILDSTLARVIMLTIFLMLALYLALVIRYKYRRRLHQRSVRQARAERASAREIEKFLPRIDAQAYPEPEDEFIEDDFYDPMQDEDGDWYYEDDGSFDDQDGESWEIFDDGDDEDFLKK